MSRNNSNNSGLPDPNVPAPDMSSLHQSTQSSQQEQTRTPIKEINGKKVYKDENGLHVYENGTKVVYMNKAGEHVYSDGTPVKQEEPPKKKKSKLPVILLVVAIIVILAVVLVKNSKKSASNEETATASYEESGKYAYDLLSNALSSYDASSVDKVVGVSSGDSYLGQEWSYANLNERRQDFILTVTSLVKINCPNDSMNNKEKAEITIPDYKKLAKEMDTDKKYIEKLYKKYLSTAENDYTYNDDLFDLMLQYILDLEELPVTKVKLSLPVTLDKDSKPIIEDDALLDDALFGSDEFHDMCAKFSQICVGYTGFKDEKYTVKEEVENPEYKEWLALFNQYYAEDGGKFTKGVSKWEPWYLRDENNVIQKDENGNDIVNYYSIKDANGNDWIEPDHTIMVDVEKTRQVEDKWVEETGIKYNCLGAHFFTTYEGESDTTIRVGDGKKDTPAGIGTAIITKALCSDGKYHDVKVAMVGYWTDKAAIDYAESFSSRNKGFTTESVIKLICYEFEVTNLEDAPITLSSEMALCDENGNIASRTGTMYGFVESLTLQPNETGIMNDWGSSTELAQKYVVWGKSFTKEAGLGVVYFDVLAGTGDIPEYSAYKMFTGASSIDESIQIKNEPLVEESDTTEEPTTDSKNKEDTE